MAACSVASWSHTWRVRIHLTLCITCQSDACELCVLTQDRRARERLEALSAARPSTHPTQRLLHTCQRDALRLYLHSERQGGHDSNERGDGGGERRGAGSEAKVARGGATVASGGSGGGSGGAASGHGDGRRCGRLSVRGRRRRGGGLIAGRLSGRLGGHLGGGAGGGGGRHGGLSSAGGGGRGGRRRHGDGGAGRRGGGLHGADGLHVGHVEDVVLEVAVGVWDAELARCAEAMKM